MVGHPGDIVNKAHMYDNLMGTTDPSSAKQHLQILVKYSRSMKDLLKEIQKLLPPLGTPRRMIDPGLPGSPTATLQSDRQGRARPNLSSHHLAQPSRRASKQRESGRVLDHEKTPVPEKVRSPPIQRKSTKCSARSGWVQSPMPKRARTPERAKTPDRGKAPMVQVS